MRNAEEWSRQATYDFETAEYMFSGGRYFYSVFMCHLSLEKMLKGMYSKIFNALPPKNHNLVYFIEILELKLIKEHSDFIGELNLASVATRYPEDLAKISKEFTQINTKQILIKTKDILQWLKNDLMK